MQENESSIPSETALPPVASDAPAPAPINTSWQGAAPDTLVAGQPLGITGWYRLGPDGGLADAVSFEELRAFERAAHVNGKDLLRGKKLKQRLDVVAQLRLLPQLVLVDWADGPVFGPPSPPTAGPDA